MLTLLPGLSIYLLIYEGLIDPPKESIYLLTRREGSLKEPGRKGLNFSLPPKQQFERCSVCMCRNSTTTYIVYMQK